MYFIDGLEYYIKKIEIIWFKVIVHRYVVVHPYKVEEKKKKKYLHIRKTSLLSLEKVQGW